MSKGRNDNNVLAGRQGTRGRNSKNGKIVKRDKHEETEVDIEWVGTILHESLRSWKYEDELFGHQLVELPDSTIIDQCLELSVPERVIYSVLVNRLKNLANPGSDNDNENSKQNIAKSHKFAIGSLNVLRQLTGHVLLIRPDIFRHLTDEDMTKIYGGIYNRVVIEESGPTEGSASQQSAESVETGLDPHADDYFVALRELQRGNTCVLCGQIAEDPRWTACNHAYCYACLMSEMHLAAAHSHSMQCKLCKLPVGQFTDEDKHEKIAKPRWLNKSGKVIPSTKSTAVVNRLKEWLVPSMGEPQAKVVVLTSFKDSIRLLAATFKERKWGFITLTSDLSSAARSESIARFRNDPKIVIMLATTGVGGTGLNLTAAR